MTATNQFQSAAHEIAIGITPPLLLGAAVTILLTAIGSTPEFSAFVGAASMFFGFRYWLDYLADLEQ